MTSIKHIVRNPAASREVWIVIAGGLNYATLEVESTKINPSPRAVQLFYLLQSTWSAVSSIGARFRVFCKES